MRWNEQQLVKYQLIHGIGIFDCNEWVVMTDVRLALNRWGSHGFPAIPGGTPKRVDLASWAIGSTQAPSGVKPGLCPQGCSFNAGVFRKAWNAIRNSNRLYVHDWVVKVDPDTVWFAERLRVHLWERMPSHGNGCCQNIFVTNCQHWNTMQGPMEVISRSGVLKMLAQQQQCGNVYGQAEDQYIVNCLQHLGVIGHMEPTLLNDGYCDGNRNCHEWWRVAFHPFKSVGAFHSCVQQAVR